MQLHLSRRRLLAALGLAIIGALSLVLTNRKLLRIAQTRLSAPPPMPLIVPREAWGARQPNHDAPNESGFAPVPTSPEWYVYPQPLEYVYYTVAIHHSAALLTSDETVLDIQNLHMDKNGWADVGYHYGIDSNGVIYEGRDIGARGASVAGYNTGTIGIVVMGNFEVDTPLPAQLTAAQTLVNWLTYTYLLTHLAAHREFNNESLCPGANMLPHLDKLAQNAGLQRGTGGYVQPV
ncbi:MAG: N-acetylmuramoyl-L-alanine amidase [Anaerolineae bacterium]